MKVLEVIASSTEAIRNGLNKASNANSGTDIPTLIGTVVNTMLFIVGVLAVIMIIFSGIRYITAHGDKGQVEGAKNTLIYSVVGLIIAIVAYALVNWILTLFGGSSSSSDQGAMILTNMVALL